MSVINYIEGIVKILEPPKQKSINNNINFITFRVQLASIRKPQIVKLMFWGNRAQDIVNQYKINQYLLIEGYSSVREFTNLQQISKRVEITVLRMYPFYLKTNNLNNKL